VLLALDAVYIAARIDQTSPVRAALRLCDPGDCSPSPPLLSRLAPESETAMAGMALTGFFGAIRGAEAAELSRLLRLEYGSFDRQTALTASPNAPLLGLQRGEGRYLLWMPKNNPNPPCIVFLHGFGGQLSIYLKALLDGGLDRYAIVAPLGGPAGWWWHEDEQARLLRLIDHGLPPQIDREHLYLVGLSNGAIGATVAATSPRFAGRFRRVVALSGAGWPASEQPPSTPILFLTGEQDPRFSLSHIENTHARLRNLGVPAELSTMAGDHFILLSKKHEVGQRILAWLQD